jgi:hypothetical protein
MQADPGLLTAGDQMAVGSDDLHILVMILQLGRQRRLPSIPAMEVLQLRLTSTNKHSLGSCAVSKTTAPLADFQLHVQRER